MPTLLSLEVDRFLALILKCQLAPALPVPCFSVSWLSSAASSVSLSCKDRTDSSSAVFELKSSSNQKLQQAENKTPWGWSLLEVKGSWKGSWLYWSIIFLSQKIDAKEFFLFLNIEFIKLYLHIHNRWILQLTESISVWITSSPVRLIKCNPVSYIVMLHIYKGKRV